MGRGGGHKRGPLSAAARKKISDAQRGKKHPHKGHPMSAETREKISKAEKARASARGSAARRGTTTSTRHPGTRSTVHSGTRRPAAKRGGLVLAANLRTRKFRSGAHRLIMVGTRRHRTGLIHGVRHHRHRIVIRRHVKHHRVWRKRKG